MVNANNTKKETKKEKALRLFEQNNTKSRKELVELFVRELNTTEGSARTHVSWCIKEFAAKKNYTHLKYNKRNIKRSELKREKAMKIFNDNPQLDRNQMIQKFVDLLEMSTNSAATHCSMCSKQYKGKSHNAVI